MLLPRPTLRPPLPSCRRRPRAAAAALPNATAVATLASPLLPRLTLRLPLLPRPMLRLLLSSRGQSRAQERGGEKLMRVEEELKRDGWWKSSWRRGWG
ncbi:hypothetical protein PR202_gb23456 [Eleusine coracana subsp. coracana]|uniref:Uncharacterized protein n=1 Tax=Eleusine coracana subsp. coracana TaxID=191504 RepID=A0AAV5FIY7_ELECO|nr:hypothetical protein PR202_gb23456 [Eleusine coracana subsp. coracana]